MVLLEVSISFCDDSPSRVVRWDWGTMVLFEVSISFCADPPPRAVRLEWGTLVLIEVSISFVLTHLQDRSDGRRELWFY